MRKISILIAGAFKCDLLITDHENGERLHVYECESFAHAIDVANSLISAEGYKVITAVNANPCERISILNLFKVC